MSRTRGLSVLRPRILWALLLAIPGCEGEDVPERPTSGVYKVVGWTLDATGCGEAGVPVQSIRPEFVRVQTTQVGPAKLVVSSCEDEACEPNVRSRTGTFEHFTWVMDEFDGNQWNGAQLDVRESQYGCEAARAEVTVSITSTRRIWVAVRHLAAADFPNDNSFVCTGDATARACSIAMADEATADQPCVIQERMAAMIFYKDWRPPRPDMRHDPVLMEDGEEWTSPRPIMPHDPIALEEGEGTWPPPRPIMPHDPVAMEEGEDTWPPPRPIMPHDPVALEEGEDTSWPPPRPIMPHDPVALAEGEDPWRPPRPVMPHDPVALEQGEDAWRPPRPNMPDDPVGLERGEDGWCPPCPCMPHEPIADDSAE